MRERGETLRRFEQLRGEAKVDQFKIQVPNGRGVSQQDVWRRHGLEGKESAELKDMLSKSDKIAIAVMELLSVRSMTPLMTIPFATSIVLVMGSPEAEPAQPRALGPAVSCARRRRASA